jgi:hypothetical protein
LIWLLTRGPESRLGAGSWLGNLAMVFSCGDCRILNGQAADQSPIGGNIQYHYGGKAGPYQLGWNQRVLP